MGEYFIGIDSGTQSTKTLVLDAASGDVVASATAHYDLIEGLPPGHKEQHPSSWTDAIDETMTAVLRAPGVAPARVRAIGVSGQQHGFVALDDADQVIRAAKLWCDTSTDTECEEIIERLGGLEATIRAVGNGIPSGFTASKILWLKKHEPQNYRRLAAVLLPHDYINFWLTGTKAMECGDASGTGLLDVRNRCWSSAAMDAVDPPVAAMLPELSSSRGITGRLRPQLAARWGLENEVVVSAGGGDNMMGAIGTGNVKPGVVTVSLGTSGTIYACSEKPIVDPEGEIAAFCDSTGKWLPLVCTMNVTVATEMVRERFDLSHEQFSEAASSAPAGNDGLMLVPFFEGERTPNIPAGTGVFFGVRGATFDVSHLSRAAMEGTAIGLNYGLDRLRSLGLETREIRATGGGSRSAVWRQILADVFNADVVCLKNEEGAALGAALQSLWAYRNSGGEVSRIEDICDRYVGLAESTRVSARPAIVATYRQMQGLHSLLVNSLRVPFEAHRALISQAPTAS